MNRTIWLILIRKTRRVFALSFLLLANAAFCIAAPLPDRLEILSLLEKHQFSGLNELIARLEEAAEKDVQNETSVHFAFDTFHVVNPALAPLLDEWVQAFPNAYQAHLGRAEYLVEDKNYGAALTLFTKALTEGEYTFSSNTRRT